MSDIKCGQQGYKGPKCKVKDYDLCDELQAGTKLTELFPGKSKNYQQNKLNYIDKQTRKDSFWLVNNEAKGLCWNGGWYLYQFPKVNGNGKHHPVAKEKDFSEKAEDFFDDTIKGYQRKVAQIKKEGANLENVVEGFWKEITGVVGAIALIATVKIIRSVKKKKKAAEAVEKGRDSNKWELGKREPAVRSEPTFSEQRFADEAPLPLTKEMRTPVSTSTPKPIPAAVSVAPTVEEPVYELSRPPSEPPVSQPPAEGRTPVGLDLSGPVCEESSSSLPGQEQPTVAVDFSAQNVDMKGSEISQSSTPTVGFQSEPSALPPKATSAEMANTGRWKLDPSVLGEPDLIIAEALHDFDPPGSLTYEDLEVQGFDLGEEKSELSSLRNYEKEYEIRMPEKTLKRAAIIAHDEIFHRLDIDDYDKILDNLVVLSFEKAAKHGENVVELDHVVEAAMQFLDVESEQAKAEFKAEVKQDLKVCKVWINRKGYETTAWNSKHASQSNGNGHSTNGTSSSDVSRSSKPVGVRVGMPGEEVSVPGFRNTEEGGVEIPEHLRSNLRPGAPAGTGKERSTTMATTQLTPDMLAKALDATATVNKYPKLPPFKSFEYWKLAREAIGEFVTKDPSFKNVWGKAEDRIAEIKIAFTTVLSESTESVAERFFNRQEGATRAGAEAAARKSTAISSGSSKPFYVAGLDPVPAVTDLYNEAEVDAMVDKAMDQDAELKGLQSFERAEYKASVMTAMKEMPGFEADFVRDGKITPEGVKAAFELCREKGGRSGSGAKAAQKVEIRKDATKAEEAFKFEDMFSEKEKAELFDPVEVAKKK